MDQSLQLTPNYHVIIKIYVKYSLKCSILKILQFHTELICRTEKSARVQNVTREEREILKNIILRENHLQSVRDKSKGQTKCQTGLRSVSKTLPLCWTDLLTAEILPDLTRPLRALGVLKQTMQWWIHHENWTYHKHKRFLNNICEMIEMKKDAVLK